MKPTTVKTFPLVLLIIALTSFSSCKKDKDEAQAITIQTISGSYKLAVWTYQFGNLPVENLLDNMEDCERDDLVNFKTDKTFTRTDAGVQCVPSDPYDGTWDLPNNKKIVLDGDEYVLESFDGKLLKISQTETSGGISEVYRMTLSKQ